ncbi:MAG: hypothetical protein HGA85_09320 [Nanoarchaeota archaeon]|nr:hypothetical protein [Nanoarchaeota archaeon]
MPPSKLNRFIAQSPGKVLIKRIPSLKKDEYGKARDFLSISKGDILLVEDISDSSEDVIKHLRENIRLIIYNTGKNSNLRPVPLVRKRELKMIECRNFALAQPDTIDRLIRSQKTGKEIIGDIIHEYKRERLSDYVKDTV